MQIENDNRAGQAAKPEGAAEANSARQLSAEVAADRASGGAPAVLAAARDNADRPGAPALTSLDAIAQQSLDRILNGAPAASDVPRFSDKYYAPVAANFDFNARTAAFEAAKSTGVQPVVNMDIQAGEVNLRGPVTFTDSGRQVLFNCQDGRKYEILPPSADNPRGCVVPFGRDASESQPLSISQQKVVPGFGDGNQTPSPRLSDANFQFAPQKMDVPRSREGQSPRAPEGAAAGNPNKPPDLSPEQIAQIKQQLLNHPEWIAQLQQSKDPRAATLLEIAGARQPGPAPASGLFEAARGNVLDAFLKQHSDQADRSAILSLLELAGRGGLPVDGQSAQARRMQELILEIGPRGFALCKALLMEAGQPLDKQWAALADPSLQMRLRDFLDLALTGGVNRPGFSDGQAAFFASAQRAPISEAGRAAEAEAAALAARQDNLRGARPGDLKDAQDAKAKEEALRQAEEEQKVRLAAAQADRPTPGQMDAAASLAAAVKQRLPEAKEEQEEEPVENAKRDEDRRQKYVVRTGDTLESIAAKILRDKQLSGLIYQINRAAIPLISQGGKRIAQLQAQMVIWLPNTADIQKFKATMAAPVDGAAAKAESIKYASVSDELIARFGAGWQAAAQPATEADTAKAPAGKSSALLLPCAEELDEAAQAALAQRRQRIESMLGPLTPKVVPAADKQYVVRLGDTLKSIASKHPELNDVQLWKLLASINGLPEAVDQNGAPLCMVRRGQMLRLPTVEEIAAFRVQLPTALPVEQAGKPSPRRTNSKMKTLAAEAKAGVATSPAQAKCSQEPPAGYTVVHQQDCGRVIAAGDLRNSASGLKLRLEAAHQGSWLPVVIYEIYQDVSIRHECKADGSRKTIRIDLPPQAAAELAHNDLLTNLSAYCLKFAARKV